MPEPTSRVAIILVHYYTPELLRRSVETLLTELETSKLQAEILVVDNGSCYRDRSMIDSLPVRHIRPGRNLGYAAAVNQAVWATQAEILICMHSDVIVLPGCLSNLVDALDQGASAAGPRFYWDRGRTLIRPVGEERTRENEVVRRLASYGAQRWALSHWRQHERRISKADQPVVTSALTGALMAMRREAWKAIGGFDECFRFYFEDADWLMRLQLRQLKAVYVPEAQAVHMELQSVALEPASEQWFQESEQIFNKRYYGFRFHGLVETLLPRRKKAAAVTATLLNGMPEIQLPVSDQSLWIEISRSALGFPAASRLIAPGEPRTWRLPDDVWKELVAGTYYIRVNDSHEKELACYQFEKTNLTIAIFGAYKSATTGLFYKIKNSLPSETHLLFEPKQYISQPKRAHVLAKVMVGVPAPSRYETFFGFDKKIYIIRDPRDWLVSGLLFLIQQEAPIYTNDDALNHLLGLFRQKETDPRCLPVYTLFEEVVRASHSHNESLEEFCQWLTEELTFLIEFEQKLDQHFLLKSEDFVDENLGALEQYLGIPLPGVAVVEKAHDHVPRTKGYGDWRNWFTEQDVPFFRPLLEPYMQHFGYDDDWTLAEHPIILPEHSSRYIERIVSKRKAQ